MADLNEQFAGLSAEERALLEMMLKEQGMDTNQLPIPVRDSSENLPLSFVQKRFWILQQLDPESYVYNVTASIKVKGVLDQETLEKALTKIIERHEVLRTIFPTEEGSPVQKILDNQPFKVNFYDFQGEDGYAKTLNKAQEEAKTVFDIGSELMLKVNLYKLGQESFVLQYVSHHLVIDGWSSRIFLNELGQTYEAVRQGVDPSLKELPIQYADYSIWQQEFLESDEMKEHLAFWTKKLEGASRVLEIPADFSRPAQETFDGQIKLLEIDGDLAKGLREVSQKGGVTLYMTLLAAFQILLRKYSGQDDLIVGTAAANVNRNELEGLIGSFSNNILFHGVFEEGLTFSSFLEKTRDTVLEAQEHQNLPFEKLLEEIHPDRDLSRNPLFQVAFIMHQGTLEQHLNFPGHELERLPIGLDASRFDLTLEVEDDKDKIAGFIEYKTDLFKPETIDRFTVHFKQLLENVVSNPEGKIDDFNILTVDEKQTLLVDWNNTEMDYASKSNLGAEFSAQAGKTPNNIALEFEGKELTYKELDEQSNQVAHYLQKLDVGVESYVGICLDRSIEMMVAVLGITKAGGAYVPMDPGFPPDRLEYMLEDSGAKVLITSSQNKEIFPNYKEKIVNIDEVKSEIDNESKEAPTSDLSSNNLAYVIYTSGSTGKPKGVQIEHKALLNFLYTMQKEPGLAEEDVLLSVTTFSFDIAGLEFYLPLLTGAKLVLVSKATAWDGQSLLKKLIDSKTTVMQATPTTWRLLIEAGWTDQISLKKLCGGEALPGDLANDLLDRPGVLWNMYGPTETTIWSTIAQITEKNKPILIGRPIGNTDVFILDGAGNQVPVGVSGELCIGGDGLARGYLDRPDLTSEKFIQNPFEGNKKIYRTGDLARYKESGEIECLGRLDYQVKLRGFRIELGEIEVDLSEHEDVQEAVVVVREDQPGNAQLVAYIIPQEGKEPSTGALKTHLKENLPDYMVPSFFVTMESFPLTPNAKIDRKALPAPEAQANERAEEFVGSRDELELQLTGIWERLLKVKSIGIRDNFFELGGHSLLAAQLFAQIEKTFGKNIPLATLFQAPTIEQIAEILRQKDWKPSWSSLVPIQPQGSKPPLFLVHGAEGNVLLYRELVDHLGKEQPVYGVQSQGLDGLKDFHEKFEDMAVDYIDEIQSLQPEGPYYLGGYCLGGAIAYEMAQQLEKKGQKVNMVAMFETYNIKAQEKPLPAYYKYLHKFQNVKYHLENLFKAMGQGNSQFFKDKANLEISRFKVSLNVKWTKLKEKFGAKNNLNYRHLMIDQINDDAQALYEPKDYEGNITLFRPKKHFSGLDDYTFGWGKLVKGNVEVKEMSVSPRGMLVEPFVKDLAEELKKDIPEREKEDTLIEA